MHSINAFSIPGSIFINSFFNFLVVNPKPLFIKWLIKCYSLFNSFDGFPLRPINFDISGQKPFHLFKFPLIKKLSKNIYNGILLILFFLIGIRLFFQKKFLHFFIIIILFFNIFYYSFFSIVYYFFSCFHLVISTCIYE